MRKDTNGAGPGDRSSDRDVLQRTLARMYERLGPRMVVVFLFAGMAFGTLAGVVMAVWAIRYLKYSTGDLLRLEALGVASVVLLAPLLLRSLRGAMGTVLSWSPVNRDADLAPAVWRAAMQLPLAITARAGVLILIQLPVVTGAFILLSGRSASSGVLLLIASAVTDCAAVIVIVLSVELALGPLRIDVARLLPADFDPATPGWRLRTKAFAPMPIIALYSALTVGAFVDLAARGPLRLALALGIALGSIACASAVFWVITRSLLYPIDELMAATDRVSRGDVLTPVPVVSGDELGALSRGFNIMLASLRRHEQHAIAADEERSRLERDIHDGAQQRLAAISMWLDGLQNRLADRGHEDERAIAQRASQELGEAIEELRRLSRGTPPPVLALHGLDAALRELAERTPGATVSGSAGAAIAPALGVAAYFAVAEGLTNALRHSAAGEIEVVLARSNGTLQIEVHDDGRGGASLDAGSGLRGLARRLEAQDGRLDIESPPGKGTVLRIELPVGRQEPER